ncbi:hypothetical protein I4U23_023322 [Adineta vaga]|nr:hypothetical protein I4U23_023322 [Adineta vaga]
MIGIPVNPNSVHVSMIQTGCTTGEFDSTYPVHLNGIISQTEYQESIHKINQAIHSNKKYFTAMWVFFTLTMVMGTICFLVSGLTAREYIRSSFFILLGLGVFFTSIGSAVVGIGACVLTTRRQAHLRQAVAEESMKYSSRSPIPCSWRLDTSRNLPGFYTNQNNYNLAYNLIIDIGRSTSMATNFHGSYSNKVAPAPASIYEQQYNPSPPSYSFQ